MENKKKGLQNHSTQDSRVVPHRGTNWAVLWLTLQIGRDAVLSESYGRGCKDLFMCVYKSNVSIHKRQKKYRGMYMSWFLQAVKWQWQKVKEYDKAPEGARSCEYRQAVPRSANMRYANKYGMPYLRTKCWRPKSNVGQTRTLQFQ